MRPQLYGDMELKNKTVSKNYQQATPIIKTENHINNKITKNTKTTSITAA